MRAIILHLSDMHFQSTVNPIVSRVEQISNSLNMCSEEEFVCFIVISGDIAYSGSAEEYKLAYEFISNLGEEIKGNEKVKQLHTIVVPGNHDCDFGDQKSTRNSLLVYLNNISTAISEIDLDWVADMSDIQRNYFEFSKCIQGSEPKDNSIYCQRNYAIGEYVLRFQCFNTAWMSTKGEVQGKLLFPTYLVNLDENPINNQAIAVSIFHHPYNWFEASNGKDFQTLINKHSHIIITGHEHDIESYTTINIRGQVKEIMQGGLLQHINENGSSYNIEVIDFDQRLQNKYIFVWDEIENFYRPEEETGWLPFLSLVNRDVFLLKDEFKKTLSRLDVQISHPYLNTPLQLEDIYVNPSLELTPARQGIISKSTIRINNILRLIEIIKEYKKVLILGGKYYGKTIVLKKLYKQFLEDDIVPLYCEGNYLKRIAANPAKSILYLFNEQYENKNGTPYNKYRQLSLDKRPLLVDNIHQTSVNLIKTGELLEIIQKHFGLLVLTSSPLITFDEMFSGPGVFIEYSRIKLNEFGLPMISDIVENWIRLSYPNNSEGEIQHSIKILEMNLFNTLGKSIIPRNPFYIHTILYDIAKSASPSALTGAYGYYFQTIINVMIAKIARNSEQIRYIFDYFSNLAFHMLKSMIGKIDKSALEDLNIQYLERTGFDLDLDQVVRNAISEDIINIKEDSYCFTYNYYFEYFVANYISVNMKKPNMKDSMLEIIDRMALHLHKEIYSNIIMFICFHTEDPIFLDIITNKAKSIFQSVGKFDIQKDVDFLNKLLPYRRIHALAAKSRKETKKEILEANDAAIKEIEELSYELRQDINSLEELTIVSKFIYALAAVKVLGQIVRMYIPGDFEDRIRLIKECYDLGLTTIKYVLGQIEECIPSAQEELAQSILKMNPSIGNEELSVATNDWIWVLSESICLVSIKNISSNVGAPELRKVYKCILERYPDMAYRFIDISIELDHFKELPQGKILGLAKRLDEVDDYFCRDLLCLLFIYHVYQFYEPIRKIQRIASVLGLEHILNEPNIFLAGQKLLPKNTT